MPKTNYVELQVVNNNWDGHHQSYDLVVLFTGNLEYEDGDGEEIILLLHTSLNKFRKVLKNNYYTVLMYTPIF